MHDSLCRKSQFSVSKLNQSTVTIDCLDIDTKLVILQ